MRERQFITIVAAILTVSSTTSAIHAIQRARALAEEVEAQLCAVELAARVAAQPPVHSSNAHG